MIDIVIKGKIMCAGDNKAPIGERFLASPVNNGPIEGEKLMRVRCYSFVERVPEGGMVISRGAEVGGSMG